MLMPSAAATSFGAWLVASWAKISHSRGEKWGLSLARQAGQCVTGDRPLGMAHTRQYIHGTTEDKYINPRSRSLTELIDFVR